MFGCPALATVELTPNAMPDPTNLEHRLLIVDHEEPAGKMLEKSLAKQGRRVFVARSAAEATELAKRGGPFEVALVAEDLPDGGGLEFIRSLKEGGPELDLKEPVGIDGRLIPVLPGRLPQPTKELSRTALGTVKLMRALNPRVRYRSG